LASFSALFSLFSLSDLRRLSSSKLIELLRFAFESLPFSLCSLGFSLKLARIWVTFDCGSAISSFEADFGMKFDLDLLTIAT
jgi:hypothetical protein